MGAAVVACGLTASAAEQNLMRNAVEGATGNVAGLEAPAVIDGWQLWLSSYEWDSNMDIFTFQESEDITENWPDNVRFENGSTLSGLTYEGAKYDANVLTLRWDGGDAHRRWFVYPVTVEKTGLYNFKMLAAEWNNYNDGDSNIKDGSDQCFIKDCGIRVVASDKPGAENAEYISDDEYDENNYGKFAGVTTDDTSKFFELTPNGGQGSDLQLCQAVLALKAEGTNYIQFNGSHAMFVAGGFELALVREVEYPDGYNNKGEGNAVEEIAAANVVSTKYYGIDGAEIANPAQGSLVIEMNVLDNGQVKVAKRIVR